METGEADRARVMERIRHVFSRKHLSFEEVGRY